MQRLRSEVNFLRQKENTSADVAVASVGNTLEESASVVPTETQQLTREQLGKLLKNVSRETIRQWEKSGKLKEEGWVVVPGTNHPVKYQKLLPNIAL